jgi:hypothetical protein
MNCYACLVETGNTIQSACAICKECGAGMCQAHAVDVTYTTSAGTTSMITASRSRLLCQRCYRALFPPGASPRAQGYTKKYSLPGKSSLRRWWLRLWHRQPVQQQGPATTLPSPEEAVNAVEQFLKQQITPKKHNDIKWSD